MGFLKIWEYNEIIIELYRNFHLSIINYSREDIWYYYEKRYDNIQ